MITELSLLKDFSTVRDYVLKSSKMMGLTLGIKRLTFGHILYKVTNKVKSHFKKKIKEMGLINNVLL